MLKAVDIDALQKVTDENFKDFGRYPKHTFDTYGLNLYGKGLFYTGFNCTDGGSGRVNISKGFFVRDGIGFVNEDEGNFIDLLDRFPTTLSVWVAIVVSGTEFPTRTLPTTFLTDTTTRATISRPESQQILRYAQATPLSGQVGADPARPAPTGSDVVVVAWVLLDNTGIVRIEPNEGGRAPNTIGLSRAITDLNVWRKSAGAQIDALGSNIAAIQGRLADVPSGVLIRSMARDLSRVNRQLNLPANRTFYSQDAFLDLTQSDITHPDYLAKVMEGIRFSPENERDSQIALLNQYDEGVFVQSNHIIPKYERETRINNIVGAQESVSIAQYNYQEIAYIQNGSTRQRLRVGPYFNTCTNWLQYYGDGKSYDALTNILRLSTGEMFQFPDDVSDYIIGRALAGYESPLPLRQRQVWLDTGSDTPYPAMSLFSGTANGAIVGQTFLCTQDGAITDLGFLLSQVGSTGDIKVLITEVPSNGQPDFDNVIATTTIPYASLKANAENYATFSPVVYVQKGRMYAIVLVTVGNHAVYVTSKNRLTNGSFFQCTDGRWAVASLDRDLCYFVNFAVFNRPRVEIGLQPLALDGGIVGIDILAKMIVMPGSTLSFEAQFNGVWTDLSVLSNPDTTPLNGMPPQLPCKAVFNGTRDIMPMLGVGPNSRVITSRPRTTMRHISKPKIMPAPVKTVTIEERIEAWDANTQTTAVKLRTGAGYNTINAPTGVQDEVPDDDPKALIRTYVFTFGSAISSYTIDTAATASNRVRTPHVALRDDLALNQ